MTPPSTRTRRRRPTGAAFFDFDRTLLATASGQIFSRHLRAHGVLSGNASAAEPILFGLFNLFGENRPSMQITKLAVRASRGWSVAAVRAAAQDAVPELVERTLPYAKSEIERHHQEGRVVVIATTTPYELVAPYAEAIGADDVIATEYGVVDGTFDGTIVGHYVWGKGKAAAVRDWCASRNTDLEQCFAYSDSFYDVPLLSSVGKPWAINPDPRLMAVAMMRRWPTRYFDSPVGVPQLGGIEPQQVAMALTRPELFPFVRMRIYGTKLIPRSGPAIIVSNHRSYFDPIAIGCALGKVGRPVRFLGKKEVFDAPLVGDFARAMGGIRVDRTSGSGEPLALAEAALEAGELVALTPQGTIPRGREFFNPLLKGRLGAARLAQATGAPIVPIGLWGTEKVWPRRSRLPNVTALLNPPAVSVNVGRPFHITSEDLVEATEEIMSRIVSQLPAVAQCWHEPSEDELLATMPPGSDSLDADAEPHRKPGTD